MDWYHPTLGLVSSSSDFVLNGETFPSNWLRQDTSGRREALGFIPTRLDSRPDDKLFFVSDTYGTIEDGVYVVRWNSEPRDPKDIAKANALAEINRLERSITDRMWREDAVSSVSVMTFAPDDPRTGKTATQYIAYVNDAIAALRAGL